MSQALPSDFENLKLLAIFHYVVAGMAGLFALFPIIHFVLGLTFMVSGLDGTGFAGQAIGCFFVVISGAWILGGLAYAGCMVAAGRYLAEQRNYRFCLVLAAVSCAFMPFGTVLGVFTILVLVKPEIKALFGVDEPGPAVG